MLDKDPTMKDEGLISLAKKHKITEAAFQKAAWFMREPERMLRRDAFAAHYLQAREKFGHANIPLDQPMFIEMAKKHHFAYLQFGGANSVSGHMEEEGLKMWNPIGTSNGMIHN